jgi:hypothetical protein
MKVSFSLNETVLARRILYTQTQSFNRKWYMVTRIDMIPEDSGEGQTGKRDDKKGGKKDAKKETKKDAKKGGKEEAV